MFSPRSLSVLCASLLLLMGLHGTLLVEALYLLRYDHVATHLCENHDRPELNCNGKCFLAKRVAETHDHVAPGDETARPAPRMLSPHLFLVPPVPTVVAPEAPSQSVRPSDMLLPDGPSLSDIFRPPWLETRVV